jgi:chaperone BCS1
LLIYTRVNFKNATRWQAENLFKCFFPCAKPAVPPADGSDTATMNLPLPRKSSTHAIPVLSEEEINALAKRFGEALPEDEMSVSIATPFLWIASLASSTR